MEEQNKKFIYKWFIITVIGGKEESIRNALIEKMTNYGYWKQEVKEIRVFMIKKTKEEIFTKNNPNLPTSMKNTRTTRWETLPDGRYKKIKCKTINRFPSYIFVNMHWDRDVWYAIRNTTGVLGFIGSTGKGSVPTPIHIHEFENILNKEIHDEYENKPSLTISTTNVSSNKDEQPNSTLNQAETKQTDAINTPLPSFKVGNVVVIKTGSFSGTKATIVSINLEKHIAKIEYDFFGRMYTIEVSFNDIKLADNL